MTTFDSAVIDPVIELAKREILTDVPAGRVPATVASFATLHDHVDANKYGGACEEDADCNWSSFDDSDEACAFWNHVQNAIDAWIKAGGITQSK
jgi:hypothetical protein